MELFFLGLLVLLMIVALTSGFPVAFSLPGASIITITLAALCGWIFVDNPDAYFHEGGPSQWLSAGVTNFRSLYWDVERDTLIAIPLFIFMGIMLQRSKVAEDLLVTMAQLFGPIPGGLGISVVLVGALLAATTGIVGATVIAMGMISLPAMLRNRYSHSLATGTICASGTLGQIIPPSIVLIILADQLSSAADQASAIRKTNYREITGEFSMPSTLDITSASAGDMFMGAFLPGLVLVCLYILYILGVALIKPEKAPPIGYSGKYDRTFVLKVAMSLLPPLVLIFVVLGSILFGVATVNQAGAVGAVGAMIMAGYRLHTNDKNRYLPAIIAIGAIVVIGIILANYDINIKNINNSDDMVGLVLALMTIGFLFVGLIWSGWRVFKTNNTLHEVMLETSKTTSMVFIILIGAAMLTSAFRAFGGEELVKDMLTALPGGFWMQFFVVMLVIFLLGFFLDFIEIAVVVVPIVAPILLADPSANITAVWLGVMIGLNIQTSFLTPPFGFALFYLRGVADKVVQTLSIYKGVVPFIGLQLLALVITGTFPALVNYFPNRTYLTSESAPPPMNPRIQPHLETQLFTTYQADQAIIQEAIDKLSNQTVNYLPSNVQQQLQTSIGQANSVFSLVNNVLTAEQAVAAYIPDYAPLHYEARRIEADIRDAEQQLKALTTEKSRLDNSSVDLARGQAIESTVLALQANISQWQTMIPDIWEAKRAEFVALTKAEEKARRDYRRNVDESYQVIIDIKTVIESVPQLEAAVPAVRQLTDVIQDDKDTAEQAMAAIKAQEQVLNQIAGTSAAKSQLSKARRALKGKKFNANTSRQHLQEAITLLSQEMAWREQASKQLLPALEAYSTQVGNSIGLRLQDKIPLDMAKEISASMSNHKNIALYF